MYIVKRASYRPPHTPTRGPHHQCSQGYEPQHQTAAGISSQAPHSSPQLKARCPCFQRGVLAGTTGRSPNSLLIPRGRGGSCPMVWRDGAEHVRMTCGRAYSHLSRQANLRDCTALRRDVGQDIPAPARRAPPRWVARRWSSQPARASSGQPRLRHNARRQTSRRPA